MKGQLVLPSQDTQKHARPMGRPIVSPKQPLLLLYCLSFWQIFLSVPLIQPLGLASPKEAGTKLSICLR